MQSFEPLVTTARSPQYNREQRHAAFAQLVTQFHGMVFTYAHQIVGDEQLAQDAIQEAFLTAYQQLAQLREPAAFPGWLRRIVHTHCHRLIRTKQLASVPLEQAEAVLLADGDLAKFLADADAAQAIVDCVMGAVADLPEHEQSVVRLFYFDGYSIRDVAAALNLPITTIKKRLQYARDRLRNRLLDQYRNGNLSLQTWALQAGQWLLPLFAVLSPALVLCPVRISAGPIPQRWSTR
ncbi:MAG: sigma-70 family RNA polymerase sigma factor [Caldilineaceae bacterium]|nr:sigma-70 family RNA polymerase sigma factor [Caldilineaceae bacterium]